MFYRQISVEPNKGIYLYMNKWYKNTLRECKMTLIELYMILVTKSYVQHTGN